MTHPKKTVAFSVPQKGLTKALNKKLDGKEKYYRGILCYLFTDIKEATKELEKEGYLKKPKKVFSAPPRTVRRKG